MESELEGEARRRVDAEKAVRRQERRVKEVLFQSEEDRKIQDRLQEQCDKFAVKCKTLKRQLEESVSPDLIEGTSFLCSAIEDLYNFITTVHSSGIIEKSFTLC